MSTLFVKVKSNVNLICQGKTLFVMSTLFVKVKSNVNLICQGKN